MCRALSLRNRYNLQFLSQVQQGPIFPGKVVSVLGVSGGVVRVCGKVNGWKWPIVHAELENRADVVSVVPPSGAIAINKWGAYRIPELENKWGL